MTTIHKTIINKNDERYTPSILVKPILKFIPPNSTIWCPFDTENSEFVIHLKEQGHKVIFSHIFLGQDFFKYTPKEDFDYIISNPPFSLKLEVLKRLYDLNKPFAMLLNLECLNYQSVGSFFLDKNLELLIVDKKVSFDGNTSSFNTSYFCNKMLPEKLMFYHLEHNNTNDNFIPSRMISPAEKAGLIFCKFTYITIFIWCKNWLIYKNYFESQYSSEFESVFGRTPKPRAEGSSPSAPAKHRPQKWLIQAVSEDFPLYFLFCRIMNSAFFYHFSITLVFGWCLEYCL